MLPLFTAAIFLSAALLFLVQPLTGKLLLPLLGGSPSVWNTCMVLFQGLLLLGYLYSHLIGKLRRLGVQAGVHVTVLAVAALLLPIATREGTWSDRSSPTLWLLETLLRTVGLPFFVVATTGPLLQRWFSRTDHPAAKDPYFLYASSNIGSVVGLLVFPFVLEPLLSRTGQSMVWTVGYGLLAALLVAVATTTLRRSEPSPPPARTIRSPAAKGAVNDLGIVDWRRRAYWIALAFVPSSLMLGVTQHVSTDVAAVPLLWIIPLLIYLLSFVSAFSKRARVSTRILGRLLPIGLLTLIYMFLAGSRSPVLVIAGSHLAVFAVVALLAHTRLADDRPDATSLTQFYLWMSVGGVLGGVFNALLAPLLFDFVLEYPIMLAAACLLTPRAAAELGERTTTPQAVRLTRLGLIVLAAVAAAASLYLAEVSITSTWIDRAVGGSDSPAFLYLSAFMRAGLPTLVAAGALLGNGSLRFATVTLILAVGSPFVGLGGQVREVERTFFGVHRVTTNADGTLNVLHHGTTLHGLQLRPWPERPQDANRIDPETRNRLFWGNRMLFSPERRAELVYLLPTSYYYPTGPIGDVMGMLTTQDRLKEIAVIGMGTGSLAAYSRPGSRFTMIEIDPAVKRIAETPDYFSFIADSAGAIDIRVGDGRLVMGDFSDRAFDLIVVDAFSSDAIPVHLLTKEAVEMYLSKLSDRGVLAFHTSNRYFDLSPVLARAASEIGAVAFERNDNAYPKAEAAEFKKDSTWVVLCRDTEHFQPLATLPNWKRLQVRPGDPLWTDDYSNLMDVFVGW